MYLQITFPHSVDLGDINYPHADDETYKYSRAEVRDIKEKLEQVIAQKCQLVGCLYKLATWYGSEYCQAFRAIAFVELSDYQEGEKASDWLRWLPRLDNYDPLRKAGNEVKTAQLVSELPLGAKLIRL